MSTSQSLNSHSQNGKIFKKYTISSLLIVPEGTFSAVQYFFPFSSFSFCDVLCK